MPVDVRPNCFYKKKHCMAKTLKELAHILARIDDEALIRQFFTQLFTPAEIRRFEQRWELVKLLDEGVPQREIARRLGLSLCNITRGSRELKKSNSAFRAILSLEELE